MSDELDQALLEDGARWRAGRAPLPDVDAAWFEAPAGRRRWPALAAAAAVVLVAAGSALAVRPAGDSAPVRVARGPVLADGDVVQAAGLVVAAPGKPIRFCPTMDADQGPYELGASCTTRSVEVTGVDLGALTAGFTAGDGTVTGRAQLRGTYTAGTVAVTAQSAYTGDDGFGALDQPGVLTDLPCRTPPGGWTVPVPGHAPPYGKIADYVTGRPDEFSGYAQGRPGGQGGPLVWVVGIAPGEDLAAERTRLADLGMFTPNLCVTGGSWSLRDGHDAAARLDQLAGEGVVGHSAPAAGLGPIQVAAVLLDQRLAAELAALPAPIEVTTWLRKVP